MKDSTILWLVIGGFVIYYIINNVASAATIPGGLPVDKGAPGTPGPTGIETPPYVPQLISRGY